MKKTLTYLLIAALSFIGHEALAANTATLSFSPVSANYSPGQIIKLNIIVNPNGATYDTVGVDINFPSDKLAVQSISLNPAFSLSSPDNSYSNAAGIISYGAGIPGGSTQAVNFATITFNVKKEGNATVSLAPSSLVLNGGENIFTGAGAVTGFTIANTQAPTPAPKPATPPAAIKNTTPVSQTKKAPEQKEETSATQTPEPSSVALAGLESSAIPIANDVTKKGLLDNYWKFIWPIALLALAAGVAFAWKKHESI